MMLIMITERTFAMALRTGNWGAMVMLPFHKPVTITLAPEGEPDQVLAFVRGLAAMPTVLDADDLDRVTVSDAGGRVLLHADRHSGAVDRATSHVLGSARDWELRLEGPQGVVHFYARGDTLPSPELLDELVQRLRIAAPVV